MALGLACVAFGWWGVKTRAGSRMFDVMAGMIPFFVGVFGGFLVVVGAGHYTWQRIRGWVTRTRYLGFVLLVMGQAIAFGSWPALVTVVLGIVPTFAWRAHAEEKLLGRAFDERYAAYRERTKTIIPHIL